MRITPDVKLDFKDVLICPKRSTLPSRKAVSVRREFVHFPHNGQRWCGVPVVASNMDTTGTVEVAKVLHRHGLLTCLHKFYTVEQLCEFAKEDWFESCAVSTGVLEESELRRLPVRRFLCLDVANGYSERFLRFVTLARRVFPEAIIIAGNVVTREMTEQLILSGADIVKVGIGPGSACTTRRVAGVGFPQLSAVMECADAAHGLQGWIMADGGCQTPGDVAKAFGAGADFVMLGGMLAGHDESGGELVADPQDPTRRFKLFYGMSSDYAMKKYYGGVAPYRSSEGRVVRVEYRGPIEATVLDILGGIRSACTYVGAVNLKAFPRCVTFVRCSQQLNPMFDSTTVARSRL